MERLKFRKFKLFKNFVTDLNLKKKRQQEIIGRSIFFQTPRMRRTTWRSFTMRVTRLALTITRTESSKSRTSAASAATCSDSRASAANLNENVARN